MSQTMNRKEIMVHRKNALILRNQASLNNEFHIRNAAEEDLQYWNEMLYKLDR